MDDNKGTSLVIIHTEKGQKLIDSVKNDLVICDIELDKVSQTMLYESVKPHPKRASFFEQLNSGKSIRELTELLKLGMMERIKNKLHKVLIK